MKTMTEKLFREIAHATKRKMEWVKGYKAKQKAKTYKVKRYLRTKPIRRKKSA